MCFIGFEGSNYACGLRAKNIHLLHAVSNKIRYKILDQDSM